jgi:hypothetical protein
MTEEAVQVIPVRPLCVLVFGKAYMTHTVSAVDIQIPQIYENPLTKTGFGVSIFETVQI